MKIHSVYRFLVMFFCLLVASCTISQASMINPMVRFHKPKVIKVKLYQHDTIMIVWVDMNGDNTCDIAYLYEKNEGYFIERKLPCKQADETDEFILEPKV